MDLSNKMQHKLNRAGRVARIGDQESGVFTWDESGGWCDLGKHWVNIPKGSRVVATWTFKGSRGWMITALDPDSIAPPARARGYITRLWDWLKPWS